MFYKKIESVRRRKEINFEKARLRIKTHGEDDKKANYYLMLAHSYKDEEEELCRMEAIHLQIMERQRMESSRE